MGWFRNLKIGAKLGVGFGAVLILVVLLGMLAMLQLSKVNASTTDLATNWLPSVQTLGTLQSDASSLRRWELYYLLNDTDAGMQEGQNKLSGVEAKVRADEKEYEPMISSNEERTLYNDYKNAWDKHLTVHTSIAEMVKQNKRKEAIARSLTQGRESF